MYVISEECYIIYNTLLKAELILLQWHLYMILCIIYSNKNIKVKRVELANKLDLRVLLRIG